MKHLSLRTSRGIVAAFLALGVFLLSPVPQAFAQYHGIGIDNLWGEPSPFVESGGDVACHLDAYCSLGDPITYILWFAYDALTLEPAGSFDDPTSTDPVWTAPGSLADGIAVRIGVYVECSEGASNGGYFDEAVVVDEIMIDSGPAGTPNPVQSGGSVNVNVSPHNDVLGHTFSYLWSAPAGTFDNPTAKSTIWHAPANPGCGGTVSYSISVTVTCSGGANDTVSYQQDVLPAGDTVTITSGPSGNPDPVVSGGLVDLILVADDSCGHGLSYSWTANGGTFNNPSSRNPVWTAPLNSTGITLTRNIAVEVTCSQGNSANASYTQDVLSVARTLYVDSTNACPGTGSFADPFCRIQPALDAALVGDTIIVRDGVYTGSQNRNLDFKGKAVTLRSENGPANCIIDCENAAAGFLFWSGETNLAILDGFTIVNGDFSYGGGIYCVNSSPIIRNCIIKNNSSAYGGGICLSSSLAQVINCTIAGNSCDYGAGGMFFYDSNGLVINCTISNNTAVSGGGVFCYNSMPTFANCIITGNVASYGPQVLLSTLSKMNVSYCNIEGGQADAYLELSSSFTWGPGNIDADPLFVQPRYWNGAQWIDGDYHVLRGSPVIDTGDNSVVPTTDIDGEDRPAGAACDIGSDEYSSISGISLVVVPGAPQIPRGGTLSLTVKALNGDATPATFDYWTTITLPSGGLYPPAGALFGPYSISLGALGSRTATMRHRIPAASPLGIYTYNAFSGVYPTNTGEYHFNFEVIP